MTGCRSTRKKRGKKCSIKEKKQGVKKQSTEIIRRKQDVCENKGRKYNRKTEK
jgi:hypothetical protein